MMYPYMILSDETKVIHSNVIEKNGHMPGAEGMEQILKEADLFLKIK